ncbi:HNH endonuclease signature motif containing protein [Humibacter sp. RRB41]|uniref:HNH endonuclease signature motif containing protein n=1 Tax=Humibacter sp. RRB41 TaxID=2919946 RepID=UPI001FAB2404|nr:HNH endonuclease signature motif containing protein [Humibacter sp. RRB41]
MSAVEILGRTVDALRVAVAVEVQERSRPTLGSDRLSARQGCRAGIELIARVTQVSEATANRRCRVGAGIRARDTLTGEVLPAAFPKVAEAMDAGELGVDSASAIITALSAVASRAEPEMLAEAEHALVGCALGVEVSSGEPITPFTADQTRIQAIQWQVALDPDGVKVCEEQATLGRGMVKLGTRGGLTRYRLDALPELEGKLERIFASCLSPKTAGRFLTVEDEAEALVGGDTRTPAQQRHDIVAAMLDAAARSGELPTIGGASPTVLISVAAEELEAGTGAGWIDGVQNPVSIDTVKRFICTGGIQKVLFDCNGKIIALSSPDRIFTPQQRRAITVRDGGCVIPGCQIPAGWCEIHHVIEHSRSGPTHTDNGVLLCWFHHHTIDTSGWQVHMVDGVPYIRPPRWIDPDRQWRRASTPHTLTHTRPPRPDRMPSRT